MPDSPVAQAARQARAASLELAALSIGARNSALEAMACALEEQRESVLAENQKDLTASEQMIVRGDLTAANAKRLDLRGSKFDGVVEGLRSVAALPDPIGRVLMATEMDEGLDLYRVSCPIGVIAVIFESRPDALPQIASLCLKSGNAVLLKGGSEAIHSNRALTKVLDEAAQSEGIPAGWISLLETREEIAEILKLEDDIDLIIPRGSNAFVRYIMDNTNIPVTGHRDGICHTYIHAAADLDKAVRITVDGKCQYPAVCNATETLLIDRAASPGILPVVAAELVRQGVELRLDPEAKRLIDTHCKENPGCYDPGKIRKAEEEDWSTEYLDLILSVRIVDGLEQAVEHINRYGSHHTDAIVTEDEKAAKKFITLVDSSSVLHNASTRFADGFRYGFGAEIGISTEKIHSRGPVGLEGLTIYKYILKGHGQIVADYSGPNARKFTHKPQPGAKRP